MAGRTIVLDIDGTLIDSCTEEEARARGITAFVETVDDDGDCGIKRPFVDAFLTHCFEHFSHVAVWTMASREWADFIITKVLHREVEDFAFVWAHEDRRYTRTGMNSVVGRGILEAEGRCDAYSYTLRIG